MVIFTLLTSQSACKDKSSQNILIKLKSLILIKELEQSIDKFLSLNFT